MKKRTSKRLVLCICVTFALFVLAGIAMYLKLETLATTCAAGMLTNFTTYTAGESYRPSKENSDLPLNTQNNAQ